MVYEFLYVDGVCVFSYDADEPLPIQYMALLDIQTTSTGASLNFNNEISGTYTYSGNGTFLGFSATQGATTPDANLAVGNTKTYESDGGYTVSYPIYLYSVAQQSSSQTISDLTNTKWLLNSTFIEMPNGHIFDAEDGNVYENHISFISNNMSFIGIYCQDKDYNYPGISYTVSNTTSIWGIWDGSSWINEAYRTIEITGGTDATNAEFITWLQQNATQIIEPSSTNNLSLGSLNISKMFIGSSEVSKVYYGSTLIYEKGSGSSGGSSGYSGNILCEWERVSLGGNVYIKFDSIPTSANDYDACTDNRRVGLSTDSITSYANKSVAYIWGRGKYIYNENTYDISATNNLSYNNAIELILTGNYDITLVFLISNGAGA